MSNFPPIPINHQFCHQDNSLRLSKLLPLDDVWIVWFLGNVELCATAATGASYLLAVWGRNRPLAVV